MPRKDERKRYPMGKVPIGKRNDNGTGSDNLYGIALASSVSSSSSSSTTTEEDPTYVHIHVCIHTNTHTCARARVCVCVYTHACTRSSSSTFSKAFFEDHRRVYSLLAATICIKARFSRDSRNNNNIQ